MANGNGNGKLSLYLIGVLVMVNISLTGWALINIVSMREAMAAQRERVIAIEKNQSALVTEVQKYHSKGG